MTVWLLRGNGEVAVLSGFPSRLYDNLSFLTSKRCKLPFAQEETSSLISAEKKPYEDTGRNTLASNSISCILSWLVSHNVVEISEVS